MPSLQLVAELLRRAASWFAQDRARAVRPRLALDGDVACEAREVRLPRDRREAVEVGDRRDVRVARQLADLAGGEAGEARALGDEVVEVRGGHELRARTAVHVDELREEELDPALLDDLPDRLEPRIRRHRHIPLLCCRVRRFYQPSPRTASGDSGSTWPPSTTSVWPVM